MESFGVYQRPLKIAKSPNLNKEKKSQKWLDGVYEKDFSILTLNYDFA